MRDDVARMEPAVGATAPGRWRNPGTKCSEGPGFRKGFIRAMGLSNALSASSLRTQGPIATGVNWMKIASSIASYRGHNAVWVPDRRSLALTCPGRHGLGFRFNCQTSRGYASSFSRRHASELCFYLRPRKKEGAGKTGCALHPRSRVQNARVKTHTSIQVQRRTPGLPCAVVSTGLYQISAIVTR